MPRGVAVQNRGHAGVIAGLLGCAFGVVGIFALAVIFIPLAGLCSIMGLLRGLLGSSTAGIGTSVLGAFLTAVGFALSPTLWVLLGAGVLATAVAPQGEVSAPPPSNRQQSQQNLVAALEARETSIRSFISQAEQLIGHMEKFSAAAAIVLPKLSAAEQQYRQTTSALREHLVHQQQLSAIPDSFTSRNNIWVAITQGVNSTEQLHNQVLSAQREFETDVVPLLNLINQAEQSCGRSATASAIPATRDALNSTCSRLTAAAPRFKENFATLSRLFTSLEQDYRSELGKQQQVSQASSRVQ